MFKLKKLNARGFAHHLLLAVVVVGVAVGGTYYLVASHADTASNPKASADCVLVAVSPSIQYSSSAGQALHTTNCNKALNDAYAAVIAGKATPAAEMTNNIQACTDMQGDGTAKASNAVQKSVSSAIASCASYAELQEVAGLNASKPASTATKTTTTTTTTPSSSSTSSTTSSSGSTAAATYVGKFVAVTCSNISVQAYNTAAGSAPVGVTVDITGGPYGAAPSQIGPASANGPGLDGKGTNYQNWATPVAVQNYSGSATLVFTLHLRNGTTDVTPTTPITYSLTPAMLSKLNCKKATAANSDASGKHQYEGHMVLATCSNIEAEAHDFGSSAPANPAKYTVTVAVSLTGGPFGKTVVTLPAILANQHTISGNSLDQDYNHWVLANYKQVAPLLTYSGTGLTTISLTVRDGSTVVAHSGNSVMTLGACVGANKTGPATSANPHPTTATATAAASKPPVPTSADTKAAVATCDKEDSSVPPSVRSQIINACITKQAQVIATTGALVAVVKVPDATEVNQATRVCDNQHPNASTASLEACVSKQAAKVLKADTDGASSAELQAAATTCATDHTGQAADQLTTCVQNEATKEVKVAAQKKAAAKIATFFKNLVGRSTICTHADIGSGNNGSCARSIQVLLDHANGNSTKLATDSKMDSTTVAAIKAFQNKNNISPVDGIVDAATWAKLCSQSSNSQASINGISVAKTNKDAGCDKQLPKPSKASPVGSVGSSSSSKVSNASGDGTADCTGVAYTHAEGSHCVCDSGTTYVSGRCEVTSAGAGTSEGPGTTGGDQNRDPGTTAASSCAGLSGKNLNVCQSGSGSNANGSSNTTCDGLTGKNLNVCQSGSGSNATGTAPAPSTNKCSKANRNTSWDQLHCALDSIGHGLNWIVNGHKNGL